MAEKTGRQGQRVRIVLRRFRAQTPREVIRGIISDVGDYGSCDSRRRFLEFPDLETSPPVERPVEGDPKVYRVPFNSIPYSGTILPGSSSEQSDKEIRRRTRN